MNVTDPHLSSRAFWYRVAHCEFSRTFVLHFAVFGADTLDILGNREWTLRVTLSALKIWVFDRGNVNSKESGHSGIFIVI